MLYGVFVWNCVKGMERCPIKLITDLGTEKVLASAKQTFFRQDIDGHQYYPHQEIKELKVGGHFLPRLGETGGNIFFFT